MTTIAYVAPFEQSWGTEEHFAADAEAIGCTVHRIRERDFAAALVGDLDSYPLPAADLWLYTKARGLPPLAGGLWRMLEAEGARTASYHLDLYRGLARQTEILDDPFWRTGTVFTADGDPATRDELAMLGIDHRWLPAACVSSETIEVDPLDYPESIEPAEIVFVGSWRGYHAEWPWRMEMIQQLRRRYGSRFGALPRSPDRPIRGLDLNALYQTPGRIAVGDSLALPGHVRYWSDRYYETIGRGGFLIAPRVPGIDAHFQDGGHFVGYDPGDLAGLFGLIDGYLDAPDAARAIARAGQAHVRENHTYRDRVTQMLVMLDLALPVESR